VSLVAGRGHGPTQAVAEAGGLVAEQAGEHVAAAEAAIQSGAAPESAGSKCATPERGPQRAAPEQGSSGRLAKKAPCALQDVSSRLRILYRRFSDLICLLTMFLASRRHSDTSVLSLAPLKRQAQSARVVSFEPRH
jgi:hypothetical protein